MPRPRPAESAPPATVRSWWLVPAALASSAAILLALHGHVLSYPFIGDDYVFLLAARAGSPSNLFGAFDTAQNYFRPIGRELYFLLVSSFANNDPRVFRLVNFGILLATVWLVARLGARLAGLRVGLLASGVYALLYPHSVQLAWISCSQDLLATLLATSATLLYLGARVWWAALAFLLALLCKESVVPLPLLLTAWEAWSIRSGGNHGGGFRIALGKTHPLWLATALWGALLITVRVWKHALVPAPGVVIPLADVSLELRHVWEGLRSALLTHIYLEQPWSALGAAVRAGGIPWLGVGIAGLCAALAFRMPRPGAGTESSDRGALKRKTGVGPAWRLGLLWSVLGAAPAGLVGHHFSAYYVSFSAIGFALLVASFLARWPVPLVAACFAAAAAMNGWANAVQDFKVAAGEAGRSGVSYVTLPRLAAQASYLDSLHAALRADPPPRGAMVYVSHAPHHAALASCGNLAPRVWFDDRSLEVVTIGAYRPRADARPKRFIRFDPARGGFMRIPEPLMEAITDGEEALIRDDCGTAIIAFERALRISLPGVHELLRIELENSLGVAAHRCGEIDRAFRAWRGALVLAPDHRDALLNMTALDAAAGRFEEAEGWTRRLLSRRPEDPHGLLYLARLRQAQGDATGAQDAWTLLRTAHRAFADSADAASTERH